MTKKALVFGLGLLGGGVATTNWLLKHGYAVTVTDMKDEATLRPSLDKIVGKVTLALGGHTEKDIEENDLIVVNPDVSLNNPYIKLAQKLGKEVANEATLFYTFWNKKTVAVTGTRGKTTTVNWVNHFLNSSFNSIVTGNSTSQPLLSVLDEAENYDYAVTELPSFLLELFEGKPDVAVITNISQDHLNRHHTMEEYAAVKANVFKNQTVEQFLVLNADHEWTDFFLKQKPAGQVRFFSMHSLRPEQTGVFYRDGQIFWKDEKGVQAVLTLGDFITERGEHNVQNLLASVLGASLAGCSWEKIAGQVATLPQVEFRQEPVFISANLKIINDTTATSPEGGMAAIKRFGGENCILITGGTDRQLDFTPWAPVVLEKINPANLIFLQGSATQKMLTLLGDKVKPEQVHETLQACLEQALAQAKGKNNVVILFSPSAKSFEKFKNEYDRGEQFNVLVSSLLKK
ncbi:MAG: UDP-N-acetylmuramoyl-L-alanine--D-glutamate ligase [bacterium]|nr:UDP-N-acetylmuramoyl-L-alanine--D-glutamate ligase [bacterium]